MSIDVFRVMRVLLLTGMLFGCATSQPAPPAPQTHDCPLDMDPNWPCQVKYP